MKILASPAFSNKAANPYNFLLYAEMAGLGGDVTEYSHARLLKNRYDILHYHWPDGYINHPSYLKTLWRMAVLLAAILICKLRHTAIIWTVHNIAPHDPYYPKLARCFLTFFSHRCSGLIFMSRHSYEEFFKTYPPYEKKPPAAIIMHGHYRTIYPPTVEKGAARQKLGLDANTPVFLFFGQIKPYKNMPSLLSAFGNLNADARLVIAGKPSLPELRAQIENAAASDPRILARLEFIQDADIPLYMGAADIVVLPYRAILNSGAVMLALSYSVPVLAPALGSMAELRQKAGIDWISLYEEDIKVADLESALRKRPPQTFDTAPYEWRDIARKTLDLYKSARENGACKARP